ncbi:hypothetical protein HPP92_024185 [Vanilla planifolia]|uniref:Uncharacterized protein n=1 Tax=Vanilla planifolia TaxID=51239 RepID=A0A835UCC2_VANPL|nr:hypothetical protein HPP92_024185 [Vanilla planifolia]
MQWKELGDSSLATGYHQMQITVHCHPAVLPSHMILYCLPEEVMRSDDDGSTKAYTLNMPLISLIQPAGGSCQPARRMAPQREVGLASAQSG